MDDRRPGCRRAWTYTETRAHTVDARWLCRRPVLTGDLRCRLRPQPVVCIPREFDDRNQQHNEQPLMDAGVDGGRGLWRQRASAEVTRANVVVRAEQVEKHAD